MGDKIRTFCSSTVGVGKITKVWGRSPQSLAIFSKKITHFKHILIQIFAWKHDLKLLQYTGAQLNKFAWAKKSTYSLHGSSTLLPSLHCKKQQGN